MSQRSQHHKSSQSKPKRTFNFVSDDEEESDHDVQPSQKGKKSKISSLDKQVCLQFSVLITQEEEKLVGDLMRYAVFMDHNKQPIKRDEITKQILKDHKNITSHIITLAQNKFKEVFGFEMLEVPSKNAKKGGSGVYILRNVSKENNFVMGAAEESADMGLLIIILSLILTNNNVIDQEQLFSQLKRLGFRQGEKHPVFDDWEKLIDTKFVKQLYLERRKGTASNADGKLLYDYRFGARANAEIDKKDILRWVAQVYGESVDETALKALDIEEQSSDSESSNDSDDDDDESSNDNSSQKPSASQKATQSSQKPSASQKATQSSQRKKKT